MSRIATRNTRSNLPCAKSTTKEHGLMRSKTVGDCVFAPPFQNTAKSQLLIVLDPTNRVTADGCFAQTRIKCQRRTIMRHLIPTIFKHISKTLLYQLANACFRVRGSCLSWTMQAITYLRHSRYLENCRAAGSPCTSTLPKNFWFNFFRL